MATKVVIQFLENPQVGFGFSYYNIVNGYKIPYSNGLDEVSISFLELGETEPTINDIAVETTLSLTIEKTLKRLIDNFIHPKLTYARVSNTIEISVNLDNEVFLTETNPSITAYFEYIPIIDAGLKYFIQWDDYFLGITQKNYQGFSTEIFGSVVLKKGDVNEILDPIRGTGLNIALEANSNLTFDEFSLADEMTYFVKLQKGAKTIFRGFIKPDGVQQSFVYDIWVVNIEAVDGLGALKDLSFVKPNGYQFVDKISMYDTIKACLDRTGSQMTVNSSIALSYDGYAGSNILKDTYLNSTRFIKNDGTTLMDCNDVLNSVLNLLSAVITQENGQWWVFRPNDLRQNEPTTFINNSNDTTFLYKFDVNLGSQIDGYYPHHAEGNQQIETKGAISAYRLNYEYGFNDGFLKNPYLKNENGKTPNWKSTPPGRPFYRKDPSGISMLTINPPYSGGLELLKSEDVFVLQGDLIILKTKISSSITSKFYFTIKTSTGLYLSIQNTWINTYFSFPIELITDVDVKTVLDYTLELPLIISNCSISITICAVGGLSQRLADIDYIDLFNETIKKSGKVGEFHTVSRKLPPSSITKENQTVFNGDGSNSLIGSIYKSDKVTLTNLWSRNGKFEQYPLLRISAEDDLRIKRNPIKVFSGSILGLIPYLSIININNVLGMFMFTKYSYDFRTKIINAEMTQFYNDELGDIEYELSYDYGNNTIKPTIKG